MSTTPLPASPYEIARDALALAEKARTEPQSLGYALSFDCHASKNNEAISRELLRVAPIVEAAEAQDAAWRTWDERAQVATSAEFERVRWLAAVKETEQAVRAARSAQL